MTEPASPFDDITIPGYDPEKAALIDFDERGRAYLQKAKRADAICSWNIHCPKEYRSFDIAHPTIQANRAQIDQILGWQVGKRGMILTGPTARGKTRTCWELIRKLAHQQSVRVRPWHAQDWFGELHKQVKYGRDDAAYWVSEAAWHPVVYVDDWGQEANIKSKEEWAQSWWFRFLDLRLERGLPLILTTNMTAKDIADRQDNVRADPLLRRLLEICEVIKFT